MSEEELVITQQDINMAEEYRRKNFRMLSYCPIALAGKRKFDDIAYAMKDTIEALSYLNIGQPWLISKMYSLGREGYRFMEAFDNKQIVYPTVLKLEIK